MPSLISIFGGFVLTAVVSIMYGCALGYLARTLEERYPPLQSRIASAFATLILLTLAGTLFGLGDWWFLAYRINKVAAWCAGVMLLLAFALATGYGWSARKLRRWDL